MRVAYFVHDLGDAAVGRRVRMLKAAGVEVSLAGFRRSAHPVARLEGIEALDLGRTHDARLSHRLVKLAQHLAENAKVREFVGDADVILARNLDMLILAAAARSRYRPQARLAYECLDIHRLMLDRGPTGAVLRSIERRLLRRADVLIISSPEFLTNYFEPSHRIAARPDLSIALVENKVFLPGRGAPRRGRRPPGPVWTIGWFGALRCARSLALLSELAARRPDLVEVVLRGKPSLTAFDGFHEQVSSGGVSFRGAYGPCDLDAIYEDVHFTWAIDYFDADANSRWLLPNRIYEGGRAGAVPIALAESATGAWLRRRDLGVLLSDPERELEPFLDRLTSEGYEALACASLKAPMNAFVADRADCLRLADVLEGAAA